MLRRGCAIGPTITDRVTKPLPGNAISGADITDAVNQSQVPAVHWIGEFTIKLGVSSAGGWLQGHRNRDDSGIASLTSEATSTPSFTAAAISTS